MSTPKPFLKWAGGKTQLLPELLRLIEPYSGTYYEPFVGGGALFFGHQPKRAYLADANRELIDCYRAIRDNVEDVILCLQEHRYDKTYFYELRKMDPFKMGLPARAARMIYLNKTCFNGLYRVNKKGQFNVPFGRYKNPTICDESNLRKVSKTLRKVAIKCRSFEFVSDVAKSGDLVYFDPPHIPETETANFTSYTDCGFNMDDQNRLAFIFDILVDRGVHVLLSNADVPWIHEHYADHQIHQLQAKRSINSKASKRGAVREVIVRGGK